MISSDFDPLSEEILKSRLSKARLIVIALFAVLLVQLWLIQIAWGPIFRRQSEGNRIQQRDITPFRGVIRDRNGDILAGNRPSYDIYVVPKEVGDRVELADKLSSLTYMDSDSANERLKWASKRSSYKPVCIKKDISRDELAVLEAHRFNLSGLLVEAKPVRYYLYGSLGSHLIGYLGEISEKELRSGKYPDNKAGDMIGKAGVESAWQHMLTGVPGTERLEVDAAGRIIRVLSRKAPESGQSLWLTIDRRLQSLADKALEEKKGAIVAMEPATGRILAMASSPSFDPNVFVEGVGQDTWSRILKSEGYPLQNRVVSGQYPPASVFKIVLALAGLDKGIISPEDEIFCSGSYHLGGHEFRCWKKGGHGAVNLHRAIVESCDVYFYNLGRKLGVDVIASYARRLGLGAQTGIGIGGEKQGLIPTRAWKLKRVGEVWHPGETMSVSIGQGYVSATPLQIVRMVSAVFNGGILYRPQIALHIENAAGEKTHVFQPVKEGEIGISKKAISVVRDAMIGVVNEPRGTGSKGISKEFVAAGKTGTAQVVRISRERSEGEGDQSELAPELRDHAWFAGIAPADDPKIAVAVIIENGGHGGRVAAPLAGELFPAYLGSK